MSHFTETVGKVVPLVINGRLGQQDAELVALLRQLAPVAASVQRPFAFVDAMRQVEAQVYDDK